MEFIETMSRTVHHKKHILAAWLPLYCAASAWAGSYYVDASAAGGGDGSFGAPFETIQQAADVMVAGDTCHIREGTYRETLNLAANGTGGSEITYAAYQDEDVILDGRDPLAAVWTQGPDNIWSTPISNDVYPLLTNNWAMVFIGNTPCVEARWPNMKYNENWQASRKWAELDEGPTEYGALVCGEIGTSGIDFNGAVLHMKWLMNRFASRTITNHTAGQNTVYYPQKDGFGDPDNFPPGAGGYDPRFYIDGKLDLLDAEEEWFYDTASQTLYLKTPGNEDPSGLDISIKARRYGITADHVDYTRFEQMQLFATSFRFGLEKVSLCRNITLRECSVLYPDENRFIDTDSNGVANLSSVAQPHFCVEDGLIEHCEFGWSEHRGLSLWARGTTVSNCVIHNTSLNGRMNYSGVRVQYGYRNSFSTSEGNTFTRNTVYNSGGIAIYHMGPGPNEVSYNHCFNAGLYAGDISVTYLPYGLKAGGTVLAYNWVHGAPTALGMRCDTLGNDIAVHHNVVWDCNRSCKWQGYGPFQVNNNTYYSEHLFFDGNDGTNGVDIMNNSDVMNNVFTNRLYFRGPDLDYASHPDENNAHFKRNVQVNKSYTGNIYDATNLFASADRATLDLRPKAGSILIDNGTVVPGITDDYAGTAPDIGAYEYDGEYWVPGTDWLNDGWPVPTSMAEATELAAQILAAVGPPSPAIAVSGNTDFGNINIGSMAEHTFTINNQSAYLDLILTASPPIQLSGNNGFSIGSGVASTNIPGGGNTTFTITFAPQTSGTYTGMVWIGSNDPDENPYPFSISGEGSSPRDLQIEYLMVGGGGGGGARVGGGGGAGGLIENFGSPVINGSSSHLVTVGEGGASGVVSGGSGYGANGGNSSIFERTAIGGGGGGARGANNGYDGGSGGGAGYDGIGGTGTPDQGTDGGDGNGFAGAGGGGGATVAGQVGNVGDFRNGGDGGNGFDASGYLGTTIGDSGVFGGGGGGGFRYEGGSETPGTGGNGGGGHGGDATSGFHGAAGLANTGGGGGGGSNDRADSTNTWHDGAAGGSGVVIIRYPKDTSYDQASGGSEYDFVAGTNTYRIHVFSSNGTFTINEPATTNGTPFVWLEQHYPGTNYAEADWSDTDSDGIFAWQEYVADTNPTNGASRLKITSIRPEAGGVQIDWQGGEQAWQYLEYSTNLLALHAWTAVHTNEPITPLTHTVIDAGGADTRFYRIRVERR